MAGAYERSIMNNKEVPVCVLKAEGTNCDRETKYAFDSAKALDSINASPRITLLSELKEKEQNLKDYKILVLPGGFANGDYGGGAGRIFGLYLTEYLKDQMLEFKEKGGLILGICNGFQILLRTGLLPFGKVGDIQAALDQNDSGHFECRQVNLKVEANNKCVFTEGMESPVSYQVAHGEGKFFTDPRTLKEIEDNNLVVFRYCNVEGNPTQEYPINPNGALNAIAGITDPSGRILGLMPHPERAVQETQYPNWRKQRIIGKPIKPQGLQIFENMVNYVKQM
ncbi:MAG: phosphoribosylformylglycinamidine synthase [Candidatus Levybacteria bacterium]|nr:phosphoribosylformylglycinamidine synthase [Candidatus Levybacteria bacterium]